MVKNSFEALGLTYKDFKPVALINFVPAGVNVRADAPWKTLKELLDYAKANPGKLKATGTGKGGIWDLSRAGMLKIAGIPSDAIPWVPSEGAAPGLAEMVAGGVPIVTCSLPEARSMIEAKKAKALAIMGDKRADICPDVLTLKELGINWTMGAWRGVGVPKNTVAVYVGETWCGSVVRLYGDLPLETPFYTSPQPSKPWVGLTEFDIDQIPYSCSHADSRLIAYSIEAKLKEKNAMMDDSLIAGLCLLCWLNGVCLGWILWRLPKLKEKNALGNP